MNELDSALFYNEKAEKLLIKDANYDNLLSVMAVRAKIYTKQKKYDSAEDVLLRCINLAIEKNYPNRLMMAYEYLTDLYIEKENYKDAYKYSKLYAEVKDSLYNMQYEKEIANLNVKYGSEKKQQQILLQQEQLRKEKIIRYFVAIGALIIFLLATLIYARYRVKSKLNKKLNEKNDIIEQKNKDILDSISYAKRIQSAILPSDKTFKKYLTKSFILYKPKDIVAGDFYWMEYKNGIILFAAADCTGHGVPGAMVSVVCNNGLNRSVREHGLTDPGEILNKTREIVVQEFEKSEEDVKDGMDIALCSLKLSESSKLSESYATLQYAGSNNPLWIIRNNELMEFKPDKQPIGKHTTEKPFTTHTIELQKGDTIYIFTDGFADQFGGKKAKKFMYKPFKELLLSIQEKTMEEQKIVLEQHFDNWKGKLEQVDDVCIIGVRI
jgi:serine phosphatase RsbU (regulator of sigma subunit)